MTSQTKMLHNNFQDNKSLLKASYLLSHNISMYQAPFTIGEKLYTEQKYQRNM
jgi:hypothetical protein